MRPSHILSSGRGGWPDATDPAGAGRRTDGRIGCHTITEELPVAPRPDRRQRRASRSFLPPRPSWSSPFRPRPPRSSSAPSAPTPNPGNGGGGGGRPEEQIVDNTNPPVRARREGVLRRVQRRARSPAATARPRRRSGCRVHFDVHAEGREQRPHARARDAALDVLSRGHRRRHRRQDRVHAHHLGDGIGHADRVLRGGRPALQRRAHHASTTDPRPFRAFTPSGALARIRTASAPRRSRCRRGSWWSTTTRTS